MRLEDLVGQRVLRNSPAIIQGKKNWAYINRPIDVIGVSDGIVTFRAVGERFKFTLDEGWVDDNWVRYEDVVTDPDKSKEQLENWFQSIVSKYEEETEL